MHLTNGLAWAIPVVLGVTEEQAHRFGGGGAVALASAEGADPIAVLRVSGSFKRDKQKEAVAVYRTDEAEHPGVAAVYDSGEYCLAGDLEVLSLPVRDDFQSYGSRRPRPAPSSRGVGGRRSSGSRPATRSTVRTSTSRSAPSRSSTGCSCTP
jgi:ATP sulfurylase